MNARMNCLISRAALVSSSSHNCRNCSRSAVLIRISSWLSFLLRFTLLSLSDIGFSSKKDIYNVYTILALSNWLKNVGWARELATEDWSDGMINCQFVEEGWLSGYIK